MEITLHYLMIFQPFTASGTSALLMVGKVKQLLKTEIKVYANCWVINIRPNFNFSHLFAGFLYFKSFYFCKGIMKRKLEVFHFIFRSLRCVRTLKNMNFKGKFVGFI